MTDVFARLGRVVARHPVRAVAAWGVLTAVGLLLAVVGVQGGTLFDRLTTGAPGVPGSESEQARDILAAQDESGPSLTLALSDVDPADPAVGEAMQAVRSDLAALDGVASVIDPLGLPDGPSSAAAAPLVSRTGDGFLVVVGLEPDLPEQQQALDAVQERLERVPDDLRDAAPDASGLVGGSSLVVEQITDQVEQDLRTGEAVALPVALLVMVLVFGGFLAAAMPLAGAVASIGVGLGALLALSYLLDLDASVVNVVTLLGLGLSIDYGLLVVSRFREELHGLLDDDGGRRARRRRGDGAVAEAVERTMGTAGRTVAFSAVTVALALSGLLLLRPPILRSVGVAGVAVVLVAVATALTLVPALLAMGGRRLAQPSVLARVPALHGVLERTADGRSDDGAFGRLAGRVQRRPWASLAGAVVVLLVLAAPLLGLQLRNSTTELLPSGTTQRAFVDLLSRDYPAASSPAVTVVAEGSLEDVTRWAEGLAGLDGVASVDPPSAAGSYVVAGVRVDDDDTAGPAAQRVVREIREQDAPFPTWVTGQAAAQIDFVDALRAGAPAALLVVVVATFVLLFLMTGSVVLPLQALVVNALSIAASLGVLVWAFQDGRLAGLLGFTPTGGVETYVVVLVVAFAFGLSMDYELFLVSRIAELRDAGVPDGEAVRRGLQRSGRIITSAAAIIVVVFAGFVAGDLLVIQEVGFALAVGILVDATLVRLVLVPATLTLLGRAAWWAPAPLRRLHARLPIGH
ncbi:MMPL family transporter [Cellulomonas massiliensis]|uniref:MMPL family transporter n=1 Tax=Cellulomonas massiliensis TaxID=1465811 RepID=UPI0002FD5D6C|nr:MMPL family transporter [Cellulomonas massiliensis]